MVPAYSHPSSNATPSRHCRAKTTKEVNDFKSLAPELSQRAFAQQNGVPRSTFQYWHSRHQKSIQNDPVAAFFESPVGLECLHRIVTAAQFVLTQLSGGSTRHCSTFLELSQLDRFAASSVGSQHNAIVQMEQAICDFGRSERERLAPIMPYRWMILAEDETFHPTICLVAIDVRSGYILLERYTKDRKAATWNEAVEEATKGLNVKVIQCVTDQARALISHAEKGLGVHQAPELFHVQHELCKATSLALSSQTKQAMETLEKSSDTEQDKNEKALEAAEARQARAKEAIRGISVDYHPVDWQNGQAKTPKELGLQLEKRIAKVEKVSQEAGLSEGCHKRIQKAKRVLPRMVKTLRLFILMMGLHVEEYGLEPSLRGPFYRYLFAGTYLMKVAERQRIAEDKRLMSLRADGLLGMWRRRDGPTEGLDEQEKERLEELALECADMFVRASSQVEGRNAHLRRHHCSSHRLSDRKLGALTVVHNFFVVRNDDSSAAERFFGQKPKDLFEHLIETLDVPKRPRARRK